MQKNKPLSVILIILNIFACICLICFAIPYLTHDTFVANPDAMLPMERWDGAGMALTLGLLPMAIANTLGCLFIIRRKTILRALFFLPTALEIAIVVHYWVTSLQ